jgi:hypothetical protein
MCIILTIEDGMTKLKWCCHIIILISGSNEKEKKRENRLENKEKKKIKFDCDQ